VSIFQSGIANIFGYDARMGRKLTRHPRGIRAAFFDPKEVVLTVTRQLEVDVFGDDEVVGHAANTCLEQWLTVSARPIGNRTNDFCLRS